MNDRPRYPAPWERALSQVRGESPGSPEGPQPTGPAPDDSGRGALGPAPESAGRPESAAPSPGGGRRRLGEPGDGPHPRLSVAELIARVGHPGQAPIDDSGDAPSGDSRDAPLGASAGGSRSRGEPEAGRANPREPASGGNTDGQGDSRIESRAARPGGSPGALPAGSTDSPPDAGARRDATGTAAPAAVPGRRPQSPSRRPNYWMRATHVVVALASVLAILGTGTVWGYLNVTDGQYTKVAALDRGSADVRDPAGQHGDENYLIVGVDSRAGANSDVGAGTSEQVEGARSDTIILVNIPASRKRVVAVSFPRDLNIDRPSCKRWDNSQAEYLTERAPAENDVKLNSAYSFGGPKCLVRVIQKLSGIRIDHFIGMDFAGFEAMVDTVGGVEVCTTIPLVDDQLGVILPDTGTQTISGETALKYVRARKVEAEGNGDYGRIKRQQKFLSSLLRKALSNQVLLDPAKLNSFINEFTRASFGDNLDTQSLITLGRSLQDVDADQVTFLTVPTDGTDAWGNETPRTRDIKNIFDAIIDDDPLPGESATPDAATAASPTPPGAPGTGSTAESPGDRDRAPRDDQVHAVAPGTVSVQVTNASHLDGFATSMSQQLSADGFVIHSVDSRIPIDSGTIVQFSGDNRAAAATVASAVPGAQLQRTRGLGNVVQVLLTDNSQAMATVPAPIGSVINAELASDSNDPGSVPLDVSVVNAGDTSCG